MKIERVPVLDISVSAINTEMALAAIGDWVASGTKQYVCFRDVNGIVESHRDPTLRAIHQQAGLVTPDGMPLVWLLKAAGHRYVERVYGPDFMLAAFARLPVRHFLYGTSEERLRHLEANLKRRFPKAQIVGTYSPPFRPLTPAEETDVVRRINQSEAELVWVGLSTPKQERWMAEHQARLDATVLLGVGAAFDIHAGAVRQAPRFIRQAGFEWLFRLLSEPKRLWRRYLINLPVFVYLVMRQRVAR